MTLCVGALVAGPPQPDASPTTARITMRESRAMSKERIPVVSKNTNELKTGAPGRFGLEVPSLLDL